MWIDDFDDTNGMTQPWEIIYDMLFTGELHEIFTDWLDTRYTASDVLTKSVERESTGASTRDWFYDEFARTVEEKGGFAGIPLPVKGQDYAYVGCSYHWIDD